MRIRVVLQQISRFLLPLYSLGGESPTYQGVSENDLTERAWRQTGRALNDAMGEK